ncbi:hypothetical protein [Sorangium sp. So ce363]|uniref:hypothetical protein n=1 Tax=Sorangium sp. So ce363 TaxID=3133304 RepID=UPI003F5F93FE
MSNTQDIELEPSQAATGRDHAIGGAPGPEDTARATKIVAKSLVRELLAQGHQASRLVLLAAALVEAVTLELQRAASGPMAPDGPDGTASMTARP